MKLEARGVGITTGSREVPGRTGLSQETSKSYNSTSRGAVYLRSILLELMDGSTISRVATDYH